MLKPDELFIENQPMLLRIHTMQHHVQKIPRPTNYPNFAIEKLVARRFMFKFY
jgi:hypothetical protein